MSEVSEPPSRSLTLLTTSREPSPRTRSLIKDISSLSANIVRLNRGKMTFKELLSRAFALGAKTLVIVGEIRGNPSIMRVYDTEPLWMNQPPIHIFTLFISGVSLSRERRHGLPEKPVSNVYVVSSDFANETHRIISLAFTRVFSATIVRPTSGKDGLRVHVIPKDNLFYVFFKMSDKFVGPVLKISEARIIGKPFEGG
ncbi:MAG: hypothetical protein QW604_00830 [Fervidicoccaceae archaeon]